MVPSGCFPLPHPASSIKDVAQELLCLVSELADICFDLCERAGLLLAVKEAIEWMA